MAAAGEAAAGAAAVEGAALEPPAGGGEERRTQGRKALPPRVFTILKPEIEKKRVGGGRANERSWTINGLKCLLNGWNKKIGKLMVGTGNGGLAADERPGGKNSGPANFRRLQKFPGRKLLPSPLRHLQNRRLKIVRKRTCK